MLQYRKQAVWAVVFVGIACAVFAGCSFLQSGTGIQSDAAARITELLESGEGSLSFSVDQEFDGVVCDSRIFLYGDGTAFYTAAVVSSDYCTGTYTLEDGRLVVSAEDGHHYEFDAVDDTLVFDAVASNADIYFGHPAQGEVFSYFELPEETEKTTG